MVNATSRFHTRQRGTRFLTAVVAILLLVTGAWFWHRAVRTVVPQDPLSEPAAVHSDRPLNRGPSPPGGSAPADVPSPTLPLTNTGLPGPGTDVDPGPADLRRTDLIPVTLTFVGTMGEAIPGLDFRWKTFAGKEASRLVMRGTLESWEQAWAGASLAQSDARGVWRGTVTRNAALVGLCESPNQFPAAPVPRTLLGIPSSIRAFVVGGTSGTEAAELRQTIVVAARLEFGIRFSYADGAPFAGKVTWRVFNAQGGQVADGRVDECNQVVDIPNAITDGTLRVVAHSSRAGFKPASIFEFRDLTSMPRMVDCTIEPAGDYRPYGIELDYNGFEKGSAGFILLLNPFGSELERIAYSGPGRTRTKSLAPFETASIIVTGSYAWIGPGIRLQADAFVEVQLPAATGGAASVEVVDEKGNAVPAAALIAAPGRRLSWSAKAPSRAFSLDGVMAWADATGRATLQNLPAGRLKLRVEAVGYEPELIEVTVQAGQTSHGASVVLQRATGSVSVSIENPGGLSRDQLLVLIYFPGSAPLFPDRAFASDSVVFTGLPEGDYVVLVRTRTNPYGWVKQVQVGRGMAMDVSFDLSKPLGKQ